MPKTDILRIIIKRLGVNLLFIAGLSGIILLKFFGTLGCMGMEDDIYCRYFSMIPYFSIFIDGILIILLIFDVWWIFIDLRKKTKYMIASIALLLIPVGAGMALDKLI